MAASLLGKIPTTAERRFSSLFSRSMVWSHHTFAPSRAGQRDHVADFDVGRVHDHAVDQQLDDLSTPLEGGVLEPAGDRGDVEWFVNSTVQSVGILAESMRALCCYAQHSHSRGCSRGLDGS